MKWSDNHGRGHEIERERERGQLTVGAVNVNDDDVRTALSPVPSDSFLCAKMIWTLDSAGRVASRVIKTNGRIAQSRHERFIQRIVLDEISDCAHWRIIFVWTPSCAGNTSYTINPNAHEHNITQLASNKTQSIGYRNHCYRFRGHP